MEQLPMMAGVAGAQTINGEIASDRDGAGAAKTSVSAFTFGDPEPILDQRSLIGYAETHRVGDWWEPPVSIEGLVRAFDVAGPHSSCVRLKVNQLVKHFRPSRYLDRANFRKFALDFLALGNGYLERRDNLAGRPLRLQHSLARYTRRGIDEGRYFFVENWKSDHEFLPGSVFHLIQEHPSQEIYGIPEFYAALQAALLGEESTLFRRRFYRNGSHAGFVFYLNEETIDNADADAIRKALRESKGPGNFRNLFIHAPKGKKDGVQIIPIAELGAKDEFFNVKRVSRDEMLSAHRTPPQLVAIVPENNGGFGDVSKAMDVFYPNEIEPIALRMLELNDWLGVRAIDFEPYVPFSGGAPN